MCVLGALGRSAACSALAACAAPSLESSAMRGISRRARSTEASMAIESRSITACVMRYSEAIRSRASPAIGGTSAAGVSDKDGADFVEFDERWEPWSNDGAFPFTNEPRVGHNDIMASLTRYDDVGWWGFAEGYRSAADNTLRAAADSPHEVEALAHPVVFLYRHAIELKMKEVILFAARLAGVAPPVINEHRLPELWTMLTDHLRLAMPDTPPDPLEATLDAQLRASAAVDPASTAFRYPHHVSAPRSEAEGSKKKRQPLPPRPSLQSQLPTLNLSVLAEVAEKTFGSLTGAVGVLDSEEEHRIDQATRQAEIARNLPNTRAPTRDT